MTQYTRPCPPAAPASVLDGRVRFSGSQWTAPYITLPLRMFYQELCSYFDTFWMMLVIKVFMSARFSGEVFFLPPIFGNVSA